MRSARTAGTGDSHRRRGTASATHRTRTQDHSPIPYRRGRSRCRQGGRRNRCTPACEVHPSHEQDQHPTPVVARGGVTMIYVSRRIKAFIDYIARVITFW
ncbi:hypothetical protein SEA_LIBERTYBELL_35 [Streptomyces phage LibertyBell]|nr:hypothetical protein SEA_LIBERTYBELL_35 [Streptomyces phage LibertyBell]